MIILLDNRFPYEGGEPFIHNEIYNCNNEDIIIYPFSDTDGESYSNILPDNITVRSFGNAACRPQIIDVLKGLFSRQLGQDLHDIYKAGISLKKVYAAIFYSVKTEMYHRLVLNDLKKITDKNTNIVFYSYWMHLQACVAARLSNDFPGSRFITRAHGYDLYEFRASSQFLPGRKIVFSKASRVFSVSKAGEAYLREKYPWVDEQKFCTSYLGTVDHGTNQYLAGQIRVVSCSNIVGVKRIDLLIRALSLLQNKTVEWIHYGDGVLRSDMENLSNTVLSDKIDFHFEGYKTNEELMNCYASRPISFFINVSESEGLPVSIMEAMSFGIPVIATDVGGTNEIVKDGYNGFLIPKDINPARMAKVIDNCLCISSDKYLTLRKNARLTWEQKFDAKVNYPLFYKTITLSEE